MFKIVRFPKNSNLSLIRSKISSTGTILNTFARWFYSLSLRGDAVTSRPCTVIWTAEISRIAADSTTS